MPRKCKHIECKTLDLRRCVHNDPIETTPDQLRVLRERAALTQHEAAIAVHKSDGRVWRRWECGERRIDEAAVHLFALLTGQAYPVRA